MIESCGSRFDLVFPQRMRKVSLFVSLLRDVSKIVIEGRTALRENCGVENEE